MARLNLNIKSVKHGNRRTIEYLTLKAIYEKKLIEAQISQLDQMSRKSL